MDYISGMIFNTMSNVTSIWRGHNPFRKSWRGAMNWIELKCDAMRCEKTESIPFVKLLLLVSITRRVEKIKRDTRNEMKWNNNKCVSITVRKPLIRIAISIVGLTTNWKWTPMSLIPPSPARTTSISHIHIYSPAHDTFQPNFIVFTMPETLTGLFRHTIFTMTHL